MSQGLYEQQFFAEREIKEIVTESRDTPYFQRVQRRPLEFKLRLFFDDDFTLDDIRRLRNWFDVEFYQPMKFSEDMTRIYYCMAVNLPTLSHNGLIQGYVDIDFRCDCPFSYSAVSSTDIYDLSSNSVIGTDIEIANLGDAECLPIIEIKKVGIGAISIVNYSNEGEELRISELVDGEELFIDCENEDIETSIPNTYRYDNHNDTYLTLVTGINRLRIYGNCHVRFLTEFKFRG